MTNIGSLSSEMGINSLEVGSSQKTSVGNIFKNTLVDHLKQTNEALIDSDKQAEDFALGKSTDIHKVMMAMERANVAMQYTIQIRNKLVEGFQEIMRMQV